jgi:RNA polymerase sigma factor FliA
MTVMDVHHHTDYASVQRTVRARDSATEQRWMFEYVPLVKRVVRNLSSHAGGAVDREDLEQIGLMGLLEALRRYGEPDDDFRHYATVRVRGAILDELRRQDWRPRGARQGAHRLRAAERTLRRELGREPTRAEVCTALDIGEPEYEQQLLDDGAQAFASFDAMFAELEVQRDERPGPEAQALNRWSLTQALLALDAREQQVIQLYYEFDLSHAEIAAALGLTAARVCQINRSALNKMKAHMNQD